MTERTTAEMLQRLLPGQPDRHIRWTRTEPDGSKGIGTLHRGAACADYVRHLRPESAAGPGMLGVMPGIQLDGRWRTPWAMLDFDTYREGAVEAFREVLDRHGMNYALTTGTTGRGMHIWFLLDGLVNLWDADRTLRFLELVARELGIIKLCRRPQNGTSKGDGILLPYRGGGLDGRGANPLFLSTGEVVPLEEANSIPKTSAAIFLEVGRRRCPQKFIEGRSVRPRLAPQPRLASMLRESTAPARWAAELQRLVGLWTEGRRHQLTMASAAYGHFLKIAPEQITDDLLTLARAAGDPEIGRRREIIERTAERAATDEALAFHRFYREAGVDAPARTALPIVQERVAGLLSRLMAEAWRGRGNRTDRSLFKTMLSLAWRHGHPHPQGVELSVAWTQLAEEANIGSSETLGNSLRRLEEANLIRRGASPQGNKSGSFILVVTERSTLPAGGDEGLRKTEEYFGLTLTLRYGAKRLGKRAEQLLDLLLWNGPQTIDALATQLNTRVTDLKKIRRALQYGDLIAFDVGNGRFHLVENIGSILADREHQDGSEKARTNQKAFHQDKRERYQKKLKAQHDRSR